MEDRTRILKRETDNNNPQGSEHAEGVQRMLGSVKPGLNSSSHAISGEAINKSNGALPPKKLPDVCRSTFSFLLHELVQLCVEKHKEGEMSLNQNEMLAYMDDTVHEHANRDSGSTHNQSGKNYSAAIQLADQIGYECGLNLVELVGIELVKLQTHRDCMKYVCKDIWNLLFKKQADRLQTNKRGGYVIQDNSFMYLVHTPRQSLDMVVEGAKAYCKARKIGAHSPYSVEETQNSVGRIKLNRNGHVAFICGILKGCISNLGFPCTIFADISNAPACAFHISLS